MQSRPSVPPAQLLFPPSSPLPSPPTGPRATWGAGDRATRAGEPPPWTDGCRTLPLALLLPCLALCPRGGCLTGTPLAGLPPVSHRDWLGRDPSRSQKQGRDLGGGRCRSCWVLIPQPCRASVRGPHHLAPPTRLGLLFLARTLTRQDGVKIAPRSWLTLQGPGGHSSLDSRSEARQWGGCPGAL